MRQEVHNHPTVQIWPRNPGVLSAMLVVATLILTGCGDSGDDGVSPPGSDAALDSSPSLDAGTEQDLDEPDVSPDVPEPTSLVVHVGAAPGVGETAAPVAGASVTVDFGDGERLEGLSDTAGEVVFVDGALSGQVKTVSAFMAGCSAATVANLPADQQLAEPEIFCARPTVPVRGSAFVLNDDANLLLVTSDKSSGSWQHASGQWSLDVTAGEPFELVALQFNSAGATVSNRGVAQTFVEWMQMSHDAVTEITRLDLADANVLEPTHFTGSFPLPSSPDSLWRRSGRVYLRTQSLAGGLMLGFPSKIDVEDDGEAVTFEGEYVDVLEASQVATSYYVQASDDGPTGGVTLVGYPGGAVDLSPPDPPQLTSRSPGDLLQPLSNTIEWELGSNAADLPLTVLLLTPEMDRVLWTVDLPAGTTDFAFPDRPSSLTDEQLFGDSPSTASIVVGHCAKEPGDHFCSRWSQSRLFAVTR